MPSDIPLSGYSPSKAVANFTARTDNWGDLPPTYLWTPTESKDIGVYNIWIDRDNSGNYTEGDLINALPVMYLGDFDGDFDVDYDDIVYFVDAYIKYWSGQGKDPACDFDKDGDIDYDDILTFVSAYIDYWTPP